MAENIVTLHPVPVKRPMTGAERAKNYRLRKKAKAMVALPASAPLLTAAQNTAGGLPAERSQRAGLIPITLPVTRRSPASLLLTVAAFALAGTGIAINAMFSRSLGSTDLAGMAFLAIGVTADCIALAVPSCAAQLWHARQRATSLIAWLVWVAVFVFAVMSGIGFASQNVTDVTQARASRVTPAVMAAQSALADAMGARDRECHGGVGRYCREREGAVADRRAALDVAMHAVAETGDPQAQAAAHIVAWVSGGTVKPTSDDFAMLRLALLALLPQAAGIVLLIARSR
jgi:hypothetical protein